MDGDPYATDAMGNRRSDERHDYTWSYRGELLSVTVKPGPPNAGAKVLYDYDVMGRLIERTHLGPLPQGQTSDAQRPFLDRRRYQWMGDHLLAEIRENQSGDMTWRRVMTPGPEGNRDTSQLLLQTFDPPEQKTYSFGRDEQGNVVALVDDAAPSGIAIPARYLYTPYGESHLERGPELRAIVYAASLTNVAGVAQNVVPNETVPGTLVVTTSIALTPNSLSGVDIQWRPANSTSWSAAQQTDFVIVHDETQATRLLLMRRDGWPKATEWRIRLTAALRDELGRSLQLPAPAAGSYDVDFDVDAGGVTPPAYRRSFPFVYDTAAASASTLDGRIPGGMNYLFRGAWTDPVTGLAYMDGAWLDAESAAYLSEQGASGNLYAFEGRMPNEVTWAAGGWNPVERPPMGEPEFAYDGGVVEHQSLEMRVAKTLAIGVATVVVGVLLAPVAPAVIAAMVTMSVMSSLTERIGEGQGIGEALIGSGKDLLPGRGVYEAATGRGLETGEELSVEDRIASAVEGLADFVCVAEGTKVRTANGDFAIESLKVGDRVLSHRDVLGGEGETKNGVVEASPIDPSEPWYVISLRTRHADHYGTAESEVKLLRPQSWLTSLNARIGTRLPISESEAKEGQVAPVVGEAEITAIDPAPRKSDGAGRRILMTSKRIANEVYRIYAKDGRGSHLEVTPEHPLLVAGKGWTRAQDLQSGDQLVTGDLQVLPVERIETRAGPVVVYNVEVEADHTFLVAGSDDGPAVWVHNAGPRLTPRSFAKKPIGRHRLLKQHWDEALRQTAVDPENNYYYKKYYWALRFGRTPSAKVARRAFGEVRNKFNAIVGEMGYPEKIIHHWNWSIDEFPGIALDPRHLLRVSHEEHMIIHRALTKGPHLTRSPILRRHAIRIGSAYPLPLPR